MEIYKITNDINGKIYIGKSVYSGQKRWHDGHLFVVENWKEYADNSILHFAMLKYGVEHFHLDIIETDIQDKDYLSEREKYWIKYYDCCILDGAEKGYNMTRGGEGGNGHKGENLAQWRKEHPEDFQKIIDNLNQWRIDNPDLVQLANKKAAQTRKEKYGKDITKAANEACRKRVRCIETGIIYDSVREASRAVGLSSNGAQISKVCNGKAKTAKKLHWEFV